MKKLFIILAMLMGISIVGAAQTPAKVERKGNVFVQNSTKKAKSEPIATSFQWQDTKGNTYPILVNPNSGRCFVMKTSSKTGKEYKQYLDEEIAKAVCKEMNIVYVEKKGGTK